MLKAMIFDFDGTIGDTLPLCIEAFRRAIPPLLGKNVSDEEIVATFGPSEEGTINRLIPGKYDEGLQSYWRWYKDLHYKCPEPFPGMRELLALLRENDIRLGLVTGKAAESGRISLEKYGLLDSFEVLEFGSPKGPRKMEGIDAVLTRFGLEPGQAAYVGDAPSDVTYSKRMGLVMYGAAWAETANAEALERLGADKVFTSVDELTVFVRETVLPGSA